jgi:hypothetical protein
MLVGVEIVWDATATLYGRDLHVTKESYTIESNTMYQYLLDGIHTYYHSRLIPERVAEASQIFLRGTHVSPK